MPTDAPWTLALPAAGPLALAADGAAVVAVGAGGVWRSADGRRWAPLGPSAPPAPPTRALVASGHVVAATAEGVYRTDAAGRWRRARRGFPTDAPVLALARMGGALVAGTLGAGAFRSDDGGASWATANAGLPFGGAGLTVHALGVSPGGPSGGLLAAHALGLHRSADGGRTWAPASVGLPPAPPDAVAAGRGAAYTSAGGALYGSTDGVRWGGVYDGAAGPVTLVGAAGGALLAHELATPADLLRSDDGGGSWASFAEGLPPDAHAAHALPAGPAAAWAVLALDPWGLWARPVAAARPRVPLELGEGTPNPFAHATVIPFRLGTPADVLLTLHDAAGAEVARVAEGPFGAGAHRVRFDGGGLPAGLYRCRLAAAGQSRARLLVLLR